MPEDDLTPSDPLSEYLRATTAGHGGDELGFDGIDAGLFDLPLQPFSEDQYLGDIPLSATSFTFSSRNSEERLRTHSTSSSNNHPFDGIGTGATGQPSPIVKEYDVGNDYTCTPCAAVDEYPKLNNSRESEKRVKSLLSVCDELEARLGHIHEHCSEENIMDCKFVLLARSLPSSMPMSLTRGQDPLGEILGLLMRLSSVLEYSQNPDTYPDNKLRRSCSRKKMGFIQAHCFILCINIMSFLASKMVLYLTSIRPQSRDKSAKKMDEARISELTRPTLRLGDMFSLWDPYDHAQRCAHSTMHACTYLMSQIEHMLNIPADQGVRGGEGDEVAMVWSPSSTSTSNSSDFAAAASLDAEPQPRQKPPTNRGNGKGKGFTSKISLASEFVAIMWEEEATSHGPDNTALLTFRRCRDEICKLTMESCASKEL